MPVKKGWLIEAAIPDLSRTSGELGGTSLKTSQGLQLLSSTFFFLFLSVLFFWEIQELLFISSLASEHIPKLLDLILKAPYKISVQYNIYSLIVHDAKEKQGIYEHS